MGKDLDFSQEDFIVKKVQGFNPNFKPSEVKKVIANVVGWVMSNPKKIFVIVSIMAIQTVIALVIETRHIINLF